MKGNAGMVRGLHIFALPVALLATLLGVLGCQPTEPVVTSRNDAVITEKVPDKEYVASNTKRVDAKMTLSPQIGGNSANFFVRIDSTRPYTEVLSVVKVALEHEGKSQPVTLTPLGSSHTFTDRVVSWQTETMSGSVMLAVEIEAIANAKLNEEWTVKLFNLPTPIGTSVTVGLSTGRVVGMEVDPLVYADPAIYSVTVFSPVTVTLSGMGARTVYPSAEDGCTGIALAWQAQAGAPQVTTTLTETVWSDDKAYCRVLAQIVVDASSAVITGLLPGSNPFTYLLQGEVVANATFANEAQASINLEVPPIERVALAAGYFHTCALTAIGGVTCWGPFEGEHVSLRTVIGTPTPTAMATLTSGVSALVAGYAHTCALTELGGVKCWGANNDGQLGDGTTTLPRSSPADAVGLTSGVRAIATGGHHTCAITYVGGVKCWGANGSRQLGDGTSDERHTPVDVKGLTSGL